MKFNKDEIKGIITELAAVAAYISLVFAAAFVIVR